MFILHEDAVIKEQIVSFKQHKIKSNVEYKHLASILIKLTKSIHKIIIIVINPSLGTS